MRISFSGPTVNLAGLTEEVRNRVLATMEAGTRLVLNDANRSIAAGGKTGRIYTRGNITHQASAPGEAPATDTGALIASGRSTAVINGDDVAGIVEYRMPYAIWLEYGTRKMLPRPFLNPAIERNRRRIAELISIALATATDQFARKR